MDIAIFIVLKRENMNLPYHKFLDIETESYRKYFQEVFFAKYDMGRDSMRVYQQFYQAVICDPKIDELNQIISVYKIPPIDYILIFRHFGDQRIHSDGHGGKSRYASLNLPISGFGNTKMVYYTENDNSSKPVATDAFYYTRSNVSKLYEFDSIDKWTLVDSSKPHNIVGSDRADPRITVCCRFHGNPKYEDLISQLV